MGLHYGCFPQERVGNQWRRFETLTSADGQKPTSDQSLPPKPKDTGLLSVLPPPPPKIDTMKKKLPVFNEVIDTTTFAEGELALMLEEAGLVDIQTLDSSIQVSLVYATDNNFLGRNVYGDLTQCYLQKEVAAMLVKAQGILKESHPNLSLLIYDGVRPQSVQKKMWNIVKGTPMQNYVAPPWPGSMHNHGAAVDLSLVNALGQPLDMGTPFDHLGPLAQPRYEDKYMREGKLTKEQVENRRLLRKVMKQAGFRIILSEWWHFNAFSKAKVRAMYPLVK